jgi:hypothetical protein
MTGLAKTKRSAQVRRKREETTGDGEWDDSMAEIQRQVGGRVERRAVKAMSFSGNIDRHGRSG